MVSAMPRSPSNHALLVADLQALVLRYREGKFSTLLADLEEFLNSKGIGVGQHRREIEKAKEKPYVPPKRDPVWKIMGFKNEREMKEFEARPDFPGWDAL